MRVFLIAVLLIGSIFSISNATAIDLITRCDNCSNPASLAKNLAGSQSRFGATVFIADFGHDRAFLYFVIDSNPLNPQGKPTDIITALNKAVVSPEIIDEITLEGTRAGSTTQAIQLLIPQNEQEHFNDMTWLLNYLQSRGINTDFALSSRFGEATKINNNTATRSGLEGCADVATTLNVNSSIFRSAFDVIDSTGAQVQVGRIVTDQHPIITETVRIVQRTSDIGTITQNIVQLNFGFGIRFGDGSLGIFGFDPARQLVGQTGCFQDAEGNPIPEDINDIDDQFTFTGSGLPDNNGSLNNMEDRLRGMGFRISGSPSGGEVEPRICTLTCLATNEAICLRNCN